MSLSDIGSWLSDNGGTAATMVGALVSGNIPAALGLGASLITQATGETDSAKQLAALQANPETVTKLEELANARQQEINRHAEAVFTAEAEAALKEQETTAKVIIEGQKVATGWFEKNSRPAMAWASLLATIGYAFYTDTPSELVLGILSGGYLAWMGLRTFDKRTSLKHGSK